MSEEYDKYCEGWSNGHSEGYQSGYNSGLSEGYSKGLQDGIILGQNESKDEAFNLGNKEGYLQGYKEGYDIGMTNGYSLVSSERVEKDTDKQSIFPQELKKDSDFLRNIIKSRTDCIEHFDFEKTHLVMKALNWKWAMWGSLEEMGVPSMSKLIIAANQRLEAAVKGFLENDCDDYMCYSGGLKASVQGFKDGYCRVTLEFIVSDWESEFQGKGDTDD